MLRALSPRTIGSAAAACGMALTAMTVQPILAAVLGDVRIVPLAPAAGATIADRQPQIDVELHSGDGTSISRRALVVRLDGVPLQGDVRIVGAHLETQPRVPLAAGRHVVTVSIGDRIQTAAVRWAFTIDPAGRLPTIRDGGDTPAYRESVPAAGQPEEELPHATRAYVNDVAPNPPYDGSFAPLIRPSFTSLGGYEGGGFYGAGFGSFYPAGIGPYYGGDMIRFVYTGPLGGGFLTLAGFGGSYPFVPFGPQYYAATVPVPYGYDGAPSPVAYCHCGLGHARRLLQTTAIRLGSGERPEGAAVPRYARRTWQFPSAAVPRFDSPLQPAAIAGRSAFHVMPLMHAGPHTFWGGAFRRRY